jgi:erythromycin esterase
MMTGNNTTNPLTISKDYFRLQDAADLDPLLERIGDAKYVLLGEATHGTHEYYTWRAEISKRLIKEKGFSFIAVEGDWPDCFKINQWVKGHTGSNKPIDDVLHAFERWHAECGTAGARAAKAGGCGTDRFWLL